MYNSASFGDFGGLAVDTTARHCSECHWLTVLRRSGDVLRPSVGDVLRPSVGAQANDHDRLMGPALVTLHSDKPARAQMDDQVMI